MSFTACSRILAITVQALQLIMRSVEACERCAKRPVVFEMLQNTRLMRHLREILSAFLCIESQISSCDSHSRSFPCNLTAHLLANS